MATQTENPDIASPHKNTPSFILRFFQTQVHYPLALTDDNNKKEEKREKRNEFKRWQKILKSTAHPPNSFFFSLLLPRLPFSLLYIFLHYPHTQKLPSMGASPFPSSSSSSTSPHLGLHFPVAGASPLRQQRQPDRITSSHAAAFLRATCSRKCLGVADPNKR
jgi:hypothetical protein